MMSEGRRWMSQPGEEENKFTFPPPFCSIQVVDGLDDAQHTAWVRAICVSLSIQMLISP